MQGSDSIGLGLVAEMDSRNGASVNEASFPWVAAILAGAAAGIVAAVTRGAATWFGNSTVVKHDVSALVYLGADKEVEYFANAPIYHDNQRFYQVRDDILTNNDPRDVLGFVVGKPKCLESPPDEWETGYYAYVVVNWHHADEFKRCVNRGFTIQVSAPATPSGSVDTSRLDNRHLVLTPFSEERKRVVDVCDGPRYSFRWEPYRKLGFASDDLKYRSLSLQSRFLIRILCLWRRVND